MSMALKVPDDMTLEEFLVWDAPWPKFWQLIDGVPVAMAPAGGRHGILQSNTVALIYNHLTARRGPCVVLTNPGVIPAFRAHRNFFIPDAAVTCDPSDIDAPGLRNPLLIVEILSPSNHAETWRNIRAYMLIATVQEILIVRSDRISVDLLRRRPDTTWPEDVATVTEGTITLDSIGLPMALSALYAGTGL